MAQKTAIVTGITVISTIAMLNSVQICLFDFLYMKLANAPPKQRKPTKTLTMVTSKTVVLNLLPSMLFDARLRRRARPTNRARRAHPSPDLHVARASAGLHLLS